MKEKLFSLVSLGFLTVGFIVGVAGADKDGPKDLAHATDELIQHVAFAEEADEINGIQTKKANVVKIERRDTKSQSPGVRIVDSSRQD